MRGFRKMRNKHVKFDLKADSKLSAPLKRNLNIKNREQLRRKLKDLLEKDQLLTSGKKKINVDPDVIKTEYENTNMANNQEDTCSQKGNGIKKKKIKRTPINATLKRKKIEKSIPSNENNKISQNPPPNIHSKKSCKPNISLQEVSRLKELQRNVEKEFFIKQKRPQVRPKVKTSQIQATLGSVKKQKLLNANTRIKQIKERTKQNVSDYRGPLPPNSSESSEDDSNKLSIRLPKEDDQESQSNESWQNIDCDNESELPTSSDATIYDEDFISSEFDSSSTDSLCDLESDSQSDDFQYFSEENTDSTYKLPDDVPEDIYVAKGAAIKHDLSESAEIAFDSDDSCPQIIEIMNKNRKQEFRNALTWNDDCNRNEIVKSIEKGYDSDDSCPVLVPIDHNFNVESDYDSDCSSGCFLDKYSDIKLDDNTNQIVHMVPEIFQADKNAGNHFDNSLLNASDTVSEYEIEGSPLKRIANMNATKANYNVITAKNKKQLNFDHERKLNGLVNTNNADTSKVLNKDHGNLNQSNYFADKIKSSNYQESNRNLTAKAHNGDVDSSKFNHIFAWKNDDQAKSDHLLSPEASLKDFTATNYSIKDKTPLKTLFFNAINSNQVIVLLKDPLYIYGTLKLKLLAGGLDIFGYNPKPYEILEVFSPRGYNLLKIEPSVKYAAHPVDEDKLNALASNFLKIDIENVRKNYDCKHDAIIILERNDNSKKVNMLRKFMVENLFPNMNILQSDRPFYTSEFLLRCVLTPTADKPLIINPIWRTIPINNASRIIVIGGKSVGKTTLVRFLSNVYLNNSPKVLLIDLDIGQPEMFVPQTISATILTTPLLGPGYLSVKEPDKALLVGQTNVVLTPQRYIQSVHELILYCRQNANYKNIPWIVNTMGYNKGFGDEIIAIICRFLNPSNIVQLESKNEINNFDIIMSKENLESMQFDIIGDMFYNNDDYHPDHILTLMPSVVSSNKKYQNDWELKPRDIRLAMIISRLSAVLNGQAEWFTDIKPVCASTDDLKLINLGDENLNTEDLLKGLIGNIVYLCKQNFNCCNECLGIGIVRGIDFPLKQIYLLSAVSMKMLKEVNCLAICGIPLPSSILINQGPKVKGVAKYVYNTIDRSSSMHIKQMYNRPQHFLTGKFKSIID